mgnify:CR=1 FL=1
MRVVFITYRGVKIFLNNLNNNGLKGGVAFHTYLLCYNQIVL